MIKLVALCLIGYVSGSLVTYPNGAVVPFDPANQAATAAHLAGTYGHPLAYHHLWKRDAEADAGLVAYSNGALVPLDPANQAATAAHLAYRSGYGVYGYPYHHLGKRDADALYLYSVPHVYAAHHVTPLVAHPNGALVPAEPAAVVQARADHLATKFGVH